ncbi:MAG: SDR family oxidoreductase [Lachnospiraceae bacterium]
MYRGWYETVCRIDQFSVYYMSKYALVHMEKEGQGSIVNISSIGSQGLAAACAKHIDISLPEAQSEDQAEAILYFASDASKAVTGQILYVDHGTTLY